jgi:GAF domain-containing protein
VTVERDKAASQLSTLSDITSEHPPEPVRGILQTAREELGMEVAFVSEVDQQRMVFRKLVGEADSFGWEEGEGVPLGDTFCRLLLEGRLPNAIPDAKADERVKFLQITGKADVGSYVGAPIRFSDGTLYGTLCVLSHSPDPLLGEREGQVRGKDAAEAAQDRSASRLDGLGAAECPSRTVPGPHRDVGLGTAGHDGRLESVSGNRSQGF